MKRPLPNDAQEAMSVDAAAGRAAWDKGDLQGAEQCFLRAWRAIPDPKLEYDYAQSLAWGFVTFYRDTKQTVKAYDWLKTLRASFGQAADPSVEFMTATVHFEAGALDEAFEAFDRLYKQYKKRPFQGSDKKYLDFYLARAGRR